jgi:hypothetical protein
VVNAKAPLFYPWERDAVPILQEAWWAHWSDWTGAENLTPPGIRSPDRPSSRRMINE